MVERVVLSLISVGIYTVANASLVQAWARSGPLRAAAAVAHHIGRNSACVQQVICASWFRIWSLGSCMRERRVEAAVMQLPRQRVAADVRWPVAAN